MWDKFLLRRKKNLVSPFDNLERLLRTNILESKNRGEGITTRSALVSVHMRVELGKYFTITAKSIKMKRNNVRKALLVPVRVHV